MSIRLSLSVPLLLSLLAFSAGAAAKPPHGAATRPAAAKSPKRAAKAEKPAAKAVAKFPAESPAKAEKPAAKAVAKFPAESPAKATAKAPAKHRVVRHVQRGSDRLDTMRTKQERASHVQVLSTVTVVGRAARPLAVFDINVEPFRFPVGTARYSPRNRRFLPRHGGERW